VFLGLILERVNKNWIGLIVANVCGLIMLLIAGKFANDGDTMQMLIAVLNSNFWLSTHVIAITVGYAGCCVAGIMGHIYILQALAQPKNLKRLESTYQNMLGILGFGLTMSFLGTMLGGVWADQSWGNGALMIVLWCAIVFHAKIAKVINPLGVAVGCVLALMVVMWAWFGVNLLSVGLHSYGFASGIAGGLILYAIAEVVFISVTVLILGRKNIKI
jgi:ABC-type transport system involved in cytochrome c biogenesis permease subunit